MGKEKNIIKFYNKRNNDILRNVEVVNIPDWMNVYLFIYLDGDIKWLELQILKK